MDIEHHDLAHEFPELKEQIHVLKTQDAHFRKQFERYDTVTTDIERLEKEDLPVSDPTIEEKKKERLALKDELYKMLTH
ncbi:DUF465 domain-containing protein [Halomonas vilamensis]|uniref:DUF465 domain-containing protein n=1 Tax=Vreelandella vilamensis TaxID=531309 RepID=A0ABU1H0Z9_9GAMM|nr:DUF465 domain-containing protein [Halomonas vilamensis]MDR5897986.1 DUF465 domain-containing protein [Halomonas vilamensis]